MGQWIWHFDGWAMSPGGWVCYIVGFLFLIKKSLDFLTRGPK